MAKNKNLELCIRIAGKVDKSLVNAINSAQGRTSSFASTISKAGIAGLAAMGAAATGTVAAIVNCTDEAAAFANQMGDVTKYVKGLADANGKISQSVWSVQEGGNGKTYAENYNAMKAAILDLSTQIPYTAKDLTRLAAAAGQSGKGIDEITGGFLKDVAMWGTAMDVSADQAGDWAAKWEQAFKMNHDQIMVLADQINYLGANSATTAAEIAQAVNSAASLGQIGGIDVSTTAAIADAMLATGVATDRVGTSIKRMVTNFNLGSSASKKQKAMWVELGFTAEGIAKSMQEDSVSTLNSIFRAIHAMPKERQIAALKELFGQWAIEGGAKVVNNLDLYSKALNMVSDPSQYSGSMLREFVIKSETPEAINTMMSSAFRALKIDVGTAFLPAKKQISTAVIDFLNQLRNMPELGLIAQQLANLFSQGVAWAGNALEHALPYIQTALDYLLQHGPQVVDLLKTIVGVFLGMTFAPAISGLLGGAGGLLRGAGGVAAGVSAGAASAGGLLSNFGGAVGANGLRATLGASVSSLISGAGFAGVSGLLGAAAASPGLLSGFQGVGSALANTGIGQYFGGIAASLSTLGATQIGGGILGGLRATGGALGEVLSGIAGPEGLGITTLLGGVRNFAGSGINAVRGSVFGQIIREDLAGLAGLRAVPGNIINSAPVQAVGNFLGAGVGVVGSAWAPFASGFGGLLASTLPIIGVLSGIIAAVSLLGDHLDSVRNLIQNVFGDSGVAVFDSFLATLQNVGNFITGLFQDGGVAAALAPLRNAFTGLFGTDAGQLFDGFVQILQSVMGVVGRIVAFANSTVKPMIQSIFSFLTSTVIPIILQTFTSAALVIANIIDNLGFAVMGVAQLIGTAIQTLLPIIGALVTAFLGIASVVIPAVLSGFEVFSRGIAQVVSAVQKIFGGIIEFISGVFTGNWTTAWNGVMDIFGGIWDGLSGLVKTPVNAAIAIVNKMVSGINGLEMDIPDWVPFGLGGKKLALNIPEIPMLAKGGFTRGPSIAGEAGTEAVISFLPAARASNIATWLKAGQMLGVSAKLADTGNHPVSLREFQPVEPNSATQTISISYSPTIVVQGNARKEDVQTALRDDKARFDAWFNEKMRENRRLRW